MRAELLEKQHGEEAGAKEPAWRDMERRWRLGDLSQSRQENFSRTVWTTFHWRGIA